ncbi:MFS transporter [Streptomyces sp. BR1]|uniref:MFS transporter n=1 Tax=Streptomyces sp. BR1 TaxID=1592323 RepID=UPI00402BDF1B
MSTGTRSGLIGRTFASVALHRNYRLFFAGQTVSLLGSWVQKFAQVWLVADLTGSSGSALGTLVACQFAPYAVLGLFGGAIGDRLDHHRAIIATQAVLAGCAVALTALAYGGSLQVWQVDAIAAVQGTVMVVDTPVRNAFVVQMVGPDQLANAIALNVSLFNAARTLGPALGGIAIAAAGVRLCFLVNAVSFVPVLAGLLLMRRGELHPRTPAPWSGPRALLRGAAEGVRLGWRIPAVRTVMALLLAVAVFGTGFNVVLPVLATDTLHGGSRLLGALFTCYGIGAVCGALGSASRGRASRTALLAACGAFGTLLVLLAPSRNVVLCGALLACTGAAFTVFTSNANTSLQAAVPDAMRTRVVALYSYALVGTSPVTGLLAGRLIELGGPVLALGAGGAVIAATAGVITLVRAGP